MTRPGRSLSGEGAIGQPISRVEALRVARQILEQAEAERRQVAAQEAGEHWEGVHGMTRNEFIEQLLSWPPPPMWDTVAKFLNDQARREELTDERAREVAPCRLAAELRRFAEALADAAGLVDVPPAPTAPPCGDFVRKLPLSAALYRGALILELRRRRAPDEADTRLRLLDQHVETLCRARADADRKAPKRD